MNQDYSEVEHWYDVAKGRYHTIIVCNIHWFNIGLKKKFQKAAKYKDCSVIGEWTKSITNHMYWCAASSPDGDEMMKRWQSLMDHLCNDHTNCYGDHTNCYGDHTDT